MKVLRAIDLRGTLAALFSMVSAFLWVTTGDVPPPLLAVTCFTVGIVFGVLGEHPSVVAQEPVELPYIPETKPR